MSDGLTSDAASQFLTLRERLIRVLGTQTVDVLLRRSLIEARPAHPILSSLRQEGDELRLDESSYDPDPADIAQAFAALNVVMLVILARMLGNELARRFAEGLGDTSFLEGARHGGPR